MLHAPTHLAAKRLRFLRNQCVAGIARALPHSSPSLLHVFLNEIVTRGVADTPGLLPAFVEPLRNAVPRFAPAEAAGVLRCIGALRYQDWELLVALADVYVGGQDDVYGNERGTEGGPVGMAE